MDYPKLNIKEFPKLISILEQAIDDPKYLDPSNCPYDPDTVRLIENALEAGRQPILMNDPQEGKNKVGRPSKQPIIPMEEVEKEIDEIRKELASLKVEGQTMDTKDRIQVIKTRAALIERVLGMKTEISGMKRFNAFVQTVIGILQDHVDPKEREVIITELKDYVEE